jgi:hypothetical protein
MNELQDALDSLAQFRRNDDGTPEAARLLIHAAQAVEEAARNAVIERKEKRIMATFGKMFKQPLTA